MARTIRTAADLRMLLAETMVSIPTFAKITGLQPSRCYEAINEIKPMTVYIRAAAQEFADAIAADPTYARKFLADVKARRDAIIARQDAILAS